jgi:hypothetical protein
MRLPTFAVGDVVLIEFDDHSEGEQHIVFEVAGRVLRRDRRSILVGTFLYYGSREVDDNCVVYTILRAAVRKLEVLKKNAGNAEVATSESVTNKG